MDKDILIVGAGPTGLMLANQLARRGLRPLIIDRHPGPSLQTRALGVQARTMEIYSHLGIMKDALKLGQPALAANLWSQGKRTARIPLGDIGQDISPYPYLLILGQDDNERLLGDALRAHGQDIQWNTELVALEQNPDHVKATLKTPDGKTKVVAAKWLAGCDGARSAVRELSGIPFEGAPYEHVFFVADVQATGTMVPGELNVYLRREGFHLFFPMRGTDHWRIVGILPDDLRKRDDLTFEDASPSVRREAGAELAFQGCSWFSTYRIHHRRAARFRDRRCFLLGDAAHIHSPVGAQGMNTGLQDAYNLAWKLALVVGGYADEALLDSYEDERVPVAKRLLETTDRAFSLLVSDSPLAALVRSKVLARAAALAMTVGAVRRLAFRTISQTGIRYPDSPLSETLEGLPKSATRAGDRFPWLKGQEFDDTRFNLILVGQRIPPKDQPGLEGLLRVHELPDSPQLPSPSFYLLRPDGHVGLAGTLFKAAAAVRYLSERLRIHG